MENILHQLRGFFFPGCGYTRNRRFHVTPTTAALCGTCMYERESVYVWVDGGLYPTRAGIDVTV